MNIKKYFKLNENETDVKTEVLAGITMFMAMVFMLIVTTNILGEAGMDKNGVFVATTLGAAITCFLLGTMYNKVYIAGPSTGIITYLTYTLVQDMGFSWEIGLLAIIIEASILLILALTNITEDILHSIPDTLKYGISAGIGLFIAFIGLQGAGIVIGDPQSLIGIGDYRNPSVLLTIIGVIITGALMKKDIKGSILIGIIITYILAILSQILGWYVVNPSIGAYSLIPTQLIDFNIISGLMNVSFHITNISQITNSMNNIVFFMITIFVFLFIDISSNLSTVIGIDSQLNEINKHKILDENYPKKESKLKEAIIPASIGSIISGLLGTTTMVTYLETAPGVAVGGCTGLASIVTGACLLTCLIFSPIITILPQFVVSPAIIIVGMMMISTLKLIDFDDVSEGLPGFLTFLFIPFTYDIGEGILLGIISYVLIKVLSGNIKDIKKGTWILFIFVLAMFLCIKFIYPI